MRALVLMALVCASIFVAVAAVSEDVESPPRSAGEAGEEAARSVALSPNGIALPEDYRTWRLIAPSYRSDNGTIRVVLGNDVAMAAIEAGKVNPWPDGAVLCKVAWAQSAHDAWAEAAVPGELNHVGLMVKDSELYGDTDGWGYAQWTGEDLVPHGEKPTFALRCHGCHVAVAGNDYVFTRPAVMP